MSKKIMLSNDARDAIVWLEGRPGVTSVVRARYVRTPNLRHQPGFSRVMQADDKSVRVRVYDRLGTRDVTIHAKAAPLRDQWLAAIAAGAVLPPPTPVAAPTPPMSGEPRARHDVSKPADLLRDAAAAQVYDVTPDLATEWLERNTRNRKLRDQVVMKYAADMKAGRWMLTGDAIAFDSNGCVVNGQHRLWAVVESGVVVPMMVAFDLAPEVVAVLDDHLKRNLSDVAGISRPGATVSTAHAAIANVLIQTSINATAADKQQAARRVSRQVQLDALDRHWDAIEFAHRDCFRSMRQRGLTVASVLAPVARAYYTQDRDRLREFGKAMLTGMNETPDDTAAIILRNYLLRSTTGSLRTVSDVVYRKAERALQAFLAHERIATLYEAPAELFPLPEERIAKKGR